MIIKLSLYLAGSQSFREGSLQASLTQRLKGHIILKVLFFRLQSKMEVQKCIFFFLFCFFFLQPYNAFSLVHVFLG